MNNILYDYFTINNSGGFKSCEKWLKQNNHDIWQDIISYCSTPILNDLPFKVKIYHYIYSEPNIPCCITCGGRVTYKNLKQCYSKCCSTKCVKNSKEYKDKWLNTWLKNNSNGESITKRNQTAISKWGNLDDYYNNIQDIKKQTIIDKYGKDYYFEADEFKHTRKETLIEKYGCDNYNNTEKTKRTRIQNGTQINDKYNIIKYDDYKKIVTNRTNTVYRNNINLINPNNLHRGRKSYHIDHKLSIKEGYKMDIPLEVISHPCNLEMIYYFDNIKKQNNCSITINELLNNIINYDKDIIFTNNEMVNNYKIVKEVANELLIKINNKNDNKQNKSN